MTLEEVKTTAEIIEALLKSLALIFGGAWTYLLFIKNRQKYPRALVSHFVTDQQISGQVRLVHVVVEISNVSTVLLSLESARTGLYQVIPAPDKYISAPLPLGGEVAELDWPPIDVRKWVWAKGDFEIEPGEKDVFGVDYLIDSSVRTVQVHSYFKNRSKKNRNIGWNCSTFVDVGRVKGDPVKVDTSMVKEEPKDDDDDRKDGQRPDDKGGKGPKDSG